MIYMEEPTYQLEIREGKMALCLIEYLTLLCDSDSKKEQYIRSVLDQIRVLISEDDGVQQ